MASTNNHRSRWPPKSSNEPFVGFCFCLFKRLLYVTSAPFVIVLRLFIVSAGIYRRWFLLWSACVHHRGPIDTETFCLWMQMASGRRRPQRQRACPNGFGLEKWPVGIPGASGRHPHRAPLARTHYRVTFRTAAAAPPCQVSPLDWDKLCRGLSLFDFIFLCHILSHVQRELNLCHLRVTCTIKVHKSSRRGGLLDLFFFFFHFKDLQIERGQTLQVQHWLIISQRGCIVFLLWILTNASSTTATSNYLPELIHKVGFSSASPKENQCNKTEMWKKPCNKAITKWPQEFILWPKPLE